MTLTKPRILINIHYLEIGGAERALLGLLSAIDTDKVDVDLFINQHTGELMSLIPPDINLLPENKRYATIEQPMIKVLRKGHIDIIIARLIAKFRHHRYIKSLVEKPKEDGSIFHYVASCVTPLLPSLSYLGEYDLAISFLTPHHIVAKKINAKTKAAWIHTDYSTVNVDKEKELPIWDSFDYIASISPDVTKSFAATFPSLKPKIIEIENIISPSFIKAQSEAFVAKEMQGDEFKILSIGRFTYAKNFENIPYIAKDLRDRGLNIKWYVIGFGDDRIIYENIKSTQTDDCVIILGKKENPYPYISACDLYAQPSRYEGKSITVREAQILGKPVLITNYPTASSQVINGSDGIICDMDNESITKAILLLAKSPEMRMRLTDYLQTKDYGNEQEIRKLYSLIND